jgi:anti-anti-sigma factor
MALPGPTVEAPARVVASGILDAASARRLKSGVSRAAACASGVVVLDLSDVTEIDCVALGAILALDSSCTATRHAVEIVAPTDRRARELLLLLGGSGRLRFRSGGCAA